MTEPKDGQIAQMEMGRAATYTIYQKIMARGGDPEYVAKGIAFEAVNILLKSAGPDRTRDFIAKLAKHVDRNE